MLNLQSARLLGIGGCLMMAAVLYTPLAHGQSAEPAAVRDVAATDPGTCFMRRNWNGHFKVTRDARTIYIKAAQTIYRLDLSVPYALLRDPWATLNDSGSANTICGPADFHLTVTNQTGAAQLPVISKMTPLTPAEAAALPKRLRP